MHRRARAAIAIALMVAAPTVSHAALSAYSQHFEGLVISSPTALGANGWVVYGNVFTPANVFIRGYGPYPAPNGGSAFSDIDAGQGGPEQGAQQLSVYSDYENPDHAVGNLVESNVFREQTIAAPDVGGYWTFQFDAKMGNLVAPSTALAFIKTIDPGNGYAMTNFLTVDMSAIGTTWGTYTITIPVDAGLAGQLMQFGFSNTATNYRSSGVFYDNVNWFRAGTVGVGGQKEPGVLELRPGFPNPFRQVTRLDFSLPQQGHADVSVYDVGGRRVATLFRGVAEAGPQAAIWDGRFADGRLAPAGVYHGVLQTATGRVMRRLVLTR